MSTTGRPASDVQSGGPDPLSGSPAGASADRGAGPASVSPQRALLVDDDADQRRLISIVLRDAFPDIQIDMVESCEKALSRDPRKFDIALIDLNLPDGSGIDLLKSLRARHNLPVILVTGERFGEPAAAAIRAGASDYLVKHGDYLRVLPIVVQKTLAQAAIENENRRLEREIRSRNEALERLNAELQRMAAHDPLTGLYNRRHFNELVHQLFSESDRYGTDLTCLMIDLDNFKGVNDRLGHQAGDRLLVLTADALRGALRASDVAARYGGDEFVIILPRTSPEDARMLARRIRSSFRDVLLQRLPEAASATLSIGIASRERHQPTTHDALVRLADDALYQAKAGGKDLIMVVRPIAVQA